MRSGRLLLGVLSAVAVVVPAVAVLVGAARPASGDSEAVVVVPPAAFTGVGATLVNQGQAWRFADGVTQQIVTRVGGGNLVTGAVVLEVYMVPPAQIDECYYTNGRLIAPDGGILLLVNGQYCNDGEGPEKQLISLGDLGAEYSGRALSMRVMRLGGNALDTADGQNMDVTGVVFRYQSDVETEFVEVDPGLEGKMTEVQGAELLEGVQVAVLLVGIGVPVLVGLFVAAVVRLLGR